MSLKILLVCLRRDVEPPLPQLPQGTQVAPQFRTAETNSNAAGLLHPLLAAVAMVVSSLTLLVNSVRIQGFPGPPSAGRAGPSAAN